MWVAAFVKGFNWSVCCLCLSGFGSSRGISSTHKHWFRVTTSNQTTVLCSVYKYYLPDHFTEEEAPESAHFYNLEKRTVAVFWIRGSFLYHKSIIKFIHGPNSQIPLGGNLPWVKTVFTNPIIPRHRPTPPHPTSTLIIWLRTSIFGSDSPRFVLYGIMRSSFGWLLSRRNPPKNPLKWNLSPGTDRKST